MPDPQGLDVHDVRVSTTAVFDQTGRPSQVTRLVFYVGDHGPFTVDYPEGAFSPDKAKADIQARVKQLRDVLSVTNPPPGF